MFCAFCCTNRSQAMLHDIGGNRSVVSVNQHVLVDLLGRDGALLGRGKWSDEQEGSSLAARAFNLQICHPSFGALMTIGASSCIAGVCCWWYATSVAAAMLTKPRNPAREAASPVEDPVAWEQAQTLTRRNAGLKLYAQSRQTSSLCAFGAACTINWLWHPRLGTRKRLTYLSSTTSAFLKHFSDGKACVFQQAHA